jgi:ketosteroid isomerase-like protein
VSALQQPRIRKRVLAVFASPAAVKHRLHSVEDVTACKRLVFAPVRLAVPNEFANVEAALQQPIWVSLSRPIRVQIDDARTEPAEQPDVFGRGAARQQQRCVKLPPRRTFNSMQFTDDILDINVANTELREGYNTGDVQRVLSVFSTGFTDLSTAEPSFYGSEARAVLKERLTRLFSLCAAKLAITIIDIVVRGDTAIDYGWRELTLTPRGGGEPKTTRTRYVNVWNKSAQGKWQIKIFIDNADLPPQMPDIQQTDALSTVS